MIMGGRVAFHFKSKEKQAEAIVQIPHLDQEVVVIQ